MKDIIIQLIISAATIIISIVTAYFTAKKELLKINFAKSEKLRELFSAMCVEVDRSLTWTNKDPARRTVSALRGQFPEELSSTIDNLLNSLNYHNPSLTKELLDQAVIQFRQLTVEHTNLKTSIFRRSSK